MDITLLILFFSSAFAIGSCSFWWGYFSGYYNNEKNYKRKHKR